MIKKDVFYEVRYRLGDKYHLSRELDWDEEKKGLYTKSWKLFLKYDGYMEDYSKPIMTSETNTEKELLKFAKKNSFYKIDRIILQANVIISLIFMALVIINSFFRIKWLTFFFYGGEFVLITVSIIVFIFLNKNDKAMQKYFKKRWELINERTNIKRNK